MSLVWVGQGENEKGVDSNSGRELINISSKYYRPTEVELLLGDPSKAKTKLNWKQMVSFEELVKLMVESDLKSN